MTPQSLTISSAENGDCLRACVASLLEVLYSLDKEEGK